MFLEFINRLCKLTGYKVNTNKPIVFLYVTDETAEMKL